MQTGPPDSDQTASSTDAQGREVDEFLDRAESAIETLDEVVDVEQELSELKRRARRSAARVSSVETALHDALAACVERDPDLTVEEVIAALLGCAGWQTRVLLHAGEQHPASSEAR
jgi:cell division septum initiation protein DivIVA